jgi:hypothetical protein
VPPCCVREKTPVVETFKTLWPVLYTRVSVKKNSQGPVASIVRLPSLLSVLRPGPGMLRLMDLLGLARSSSGVIARRRAFTFGRGDACGGSAPG